MLEPALLWREEDDGDWELLVDGEHFGVVCPHRPEYCLLVWDCGEKKNIAATLEEAKHVFERIARVTARAEAAYQAIIASEEN